VATAHVPVLRAEAVGILAPRPGLFVDATAGAGGHAEALLEADPGIRLLAIDRDPAALALCRERLARFGARASFHLGDFGELGRALDEAGGAAPAGILADLGVSSMQLDTAERGFSFRRDGPLDMRMGETARRAADIVNGASAAELTRIFREYGEEPMASKIAARIVQERGKAPIVSTGQLAALVSRVVRRRGRIDPATKVFQALRIEVNQELAALDRFLKQAVERLEIQGRLAVIAYHSLEDRRVKEFLRRESASCLCPPGLPSCVCGARQVLRILTRRPIRPQPAEVAVNPRARSARLRAAEKVAATG
jgi:16S rRNA (cytosine1402-N4)-methyltransferase